MPPAAATSSAVPRSGCSAISSVGTPIAERQLPASDDEARRQRPLVQEPRARQRHRELHDLRRLEAHDAEVEPALRAHGDVADEHDGDQQHEPDDSTPTGAIAADSRGGICASMIIATSPSAKRSRCASSMGRLLPDALNSTMVPTPPTRHSATNSGPSRCSASSSRVRAGERALSARGVESVVVHSAQRHSVFVGVATGGAGLRFASCSAHCSGVSR